MKGGLPHADDCPPRRSNLSVQRALAVAQPLVEEGAQRTRDDILKHLSQQPHMEPSSTLCFHGRVFVKSPPAAPSAVWVSTDKPRSDKHGDGAPDWLDATEVRLHATPKELRSVCVTSQPSMRDDALQYSDSDEVLRTKVQALANLLRVSRSTLAYTGAGLSIDAGLCRSAAPLLHLSKPPVHSLPTGTVLVSLTPQQASRKRLPVPRAKPIAEPASTRFQHSRILCWQLSTAGTCCMHGFSRTTTVCRKKRAIVKRTSMKFTEAGSTLAIRL